MWRIKCITHPHNHTNNTIAIASSTIKPWTPVKVLTFLKLLRSDSGLYRTTFPPPTSLSVHFQSTTQWFKFPNVNLCFSNMTNCYYNIKREHILQHLLTLHECELDLRPLQYMPNVLIPFFIETLLQVALFTIEMIKQQHLGSVHNHTTHKKYPSLMLTCILLTQTQNIQDDAGAGASEKWIAQHLLTQRQSSWVPTDPAAIGKPQRCFSIQIQ